MKDLCTGEVPKVSDITKIKNSIYSNMTMSTSFRSLYLSKVKVMFSCDIIYTFEAGIIPTT
mgnify:CR=1 FL=1